MSGKFGAVDPVANDQNASKTNMMDMWRESITRAQERRTSVQSVSDHVAEQLDLEQKIRSGEVECPTCKTRAYADDSDDGGVSFQAAKHIAASTAAVRVFSHEAEHVGAEDRKAREAGGEVVDSRVSLQYDICPDCGRRYVSGGLTETTVRRPVKNQPQQTGQESVRPGGLDATV